MAAVLVKRSIAYVRLLVKISGSTTVKAQIKANQLRLVIVKLLFISPRLTNLREGFRGAYKRRGLYSCGHVTGIEKSASKQAIAVLIQIRFALISN